jgi:mRNA interferase MazF
MSEREPNTPRRGEVWLVDLDPTRGREQAGRRPALVLSVDDFNLGPARLVIVAPVTGRRRAIPAHVHVEPPEGGLRQPSAVLCDGVRSISTDRLITRWGSLAPRTMAVIEDCLRILLGL